MTPRERVKKALNFEEVDRIPIENAFGGEIGQKYPSDVTGPPYTYAPSSRAWGQGGKKGRFMDAWGCLWEAGEDGVLGEVVQAPLAGDGWEALPTYQPPWEILEKADMSPVNPACAASDRFMMPMWWACQGPFERMQWLRGPAQLYLDLAYLERGVYALRDMVHEYYLRQLGMWVKTDVDGIHFADDWGSQEALLIAPDLWRAFFKPLYKEYCDLAHAHGKYVVMHSDGFIRDILPDLIEIGVNAVNAQLFCMPIEELADEFAGRICFWGEIDRQRLLTAGTTEEVRAAVRRVARAFLKKRRTGVVGQCFDGKGHKMENCQAVYDEWSKI